MKNLIGSLRMPSSLWDVGFDGLMDRQSVCLEAANLIEEQAREIERLKAALASSESGYKNLFEKNITLTKKLMFGERFLEQDDEE